MSGLDELDVVIRKKNNRVVAGIPWIGLYATADTTAAALDALEAKKSAYLADLAEAGVSDRVDLEGYVAGTSIAKPKRGELRFVAMKTGIVAGIIAAVVFLVGGLLIVAADATLDKAVTSIRTQLAPITSAKIGGAQFWSKLEAEIEAQAHNDLPPEKQQKLLANLRAIVTRVRPFVAELAPLFSDPRSPDGQAAALVCK